MEFIRWSLLVIPLLFAAACTPAAEPTATPVPTDPPAPMDTPVPSPTPIPPTPTPVTRVEVEDPAEDGFHCVSGEEGAASVPLPPIVDVTRAWVEIDPDIQVYLFSVQFGGAEALNQPFVGGVHVYDSKVGLVEPFDPTWYFNNTTNWSLNFLFTPPDNVSVFLARLEDGTWNANAGKADSTASVEGNVLTVVVPFEQVAEMGTWGWGLTNQAFAVCERVGYDESDRPSLELPPRP
ncbi:MAG: hypothetical protein ACE5MM_06565 [Nitrospiraceae bacterium]